MEIFQDAARVTAAISDETKNIDKTDQTNLVDKVSEKRVVVSDTTEAGGDSKYTTALPGSQYIAYVNIIPFPVATAMLKRFRKLFQQSTKCHPQYNL